MQTYIPRNIENAFTSISKQFPVVMIIGSRQVGKSTLLNHTFAHVSPKINRVTLDDLRLRSLAIDDPELFLDTFSCPLIIDEFQYAPNLLSYIKIRVDNKILESFKSDKSSSGMYYLTGSQIFESMSSVSESLAGRVAIIDLYGFSNREISNNQAQLFIPNITEIKKSIPNNDDTVLDTFKNIFRGSFPRLLSSNNLNLTLILNRILEHTSKKIFEK